MYFSLKLKNIHNFLVNDPTVLIIFFNTVYNLKNVCLGHGYAINS